MKKKSFFSRKWQHVAGLEIGNGKISCWIGAYEKEEKPNILGTASGPTNGLVQGQIVDVGAFEKAVFHVIYEAEKQARVEISNVLVALSGSCFTSCHYTLKTSLSNHTVTTQEINHFKQQIHLQKDGFYPVHIVPLTFEIDHQKGIRDPRGMVGGKELVGFFHVLWVPIPFLKTLLAILKRFQLNVVNVIFSGCSSSLVCLSEDEKFLGATLVDIGYSQTTLSAFYDNSLLAVRNIPLGGNHITQDIARGCDTPLSYAERLKVLYGAASLSQRDFQEMIPLVPLQEMRGGENPQISRSFLINIIQSRNDEILRSVKNALNTLSQYYPFPSQRIVLTGGASQLPGLLEKAQVILDRPVYEGRPFLIQTAPNDTHGLFSKDSSSLQNGKFLSADLTTVAGIFLYKGLSPLITESSLIHFNNHKKAKLKEIFSWFKKKI